MPNPNHEKVTGLERDWPDWQIWAVPTFDGNKRGTIWCARRWDGQPGGTVLNEDTAEALAEAIAREEAK